MTQAPFMTEIVDLGRELYNGMPNLGANLTAFFPLETYAATRRMSQGRVGFEGRTTLNRKDFGVNFNATLETGGVLVSDKINLELDISAIKIK